MSRTRGGAAGAAPRGLLTVALACLVLAGCGGGSGDGSGAPYTLRSVKAGFVSKADLGGKGILAIEDTEHSNHIIYTPTDSVPTCPYSQRADDLTHHVQASVELDGGNSTGRFIVGPQDPRSRQPVVTQGAVVFKSSALAAQGMKKVTEAASKCPSAFTILGGPPQIIGHYTVNSRPFSLEGWSGFAQQLAHTSPEDVNAETYDDLETVVLRKENAILYAGFALVKRIGQRADSAARAQATMKRTLSRLG